MAGVIFVPVDVDDPVVADPDFDSLRSAWLRAGFQQPRLTFAG